MERITRVRVAILLSIICVVLGFYTIRLYDLQIIENDGSTSNQKTFTTITRVKAARGDILDRNGNVLVTNRATYDLVFNYYVIVSTEDTNEHLLRLVQLCRELDVQWVDNFPISKDAPFEYTLSDFNSTWQRYFQSYLSEVSKSGLDSDISAPLLMQSLRTLYGIPEDWSDSDARAVIGLRYELKLRALPGSTLSNYVLLEDVQTKVLSAILELNIPGLTTEESMVRVYNTDYAAHILGYLGAIEPEQWTNTYKDKKGYNLDTLIGQAGFEEAFEDYLHGTDGYRVDVVDVNGNLVDQYYKKDSNGEEQRPIAGQNVELTIDINLQATAEDNMDILIQALRATAVVGEDGQIVSQPDGSDIEGGAVVVMDVKTGAVLACASYPTYSLDTFREDYADLSQDKTAPLFNRALMATYAPGSTYKMNMLIAGINSGVITSETDIVDRGIFTKYAGFTAKCLQYSKYGLDHGHVNGAYSLCVSCNYYYYVLGDMINWSIVDTTAKALGLGEATGIELPEKLGYRANAENKAKLFAGTDRSGWYAADKVMASIGQSINQYTPMQLCVYTSTLANRGTRYKATFLNRVLSSDYQNLEFVNQPEVVSQFQISDDAYASYTKGMRDVALTGTARRVFANYPIAVAAKTGTAETDSGGSDNGAFVCYAPFDDPQIAVVVYGEKAGGGSTMGQVAKAILDTYFEKELVGNVSTGENQIS